MERAIKKIKAKTATDDDVDDDDDDDVDDDDDDDVDDDDITGDVLKLLGEDGIRLITQRTTYMKLESGPGI